MSLGLKGLKNPYCLHVPVNQNGSGMEKKCVVCSEAKTIYQEDKLQNCPDFDSTLCATPCFQVYHQS